MGAVILHFDVTEQEEQAAADHRVSAQTVLEAGPTVAEGRLLERPLSP